MEISEAQAILDEMIKCEKDSLIDEVRTLEEEKVLAVAPPPAGFESTVTPEEAASFVRLADDTILERRRTITKLEQLPAKILDLKVHLDGNMTIVRLTVQDPPNSIDVRPLPTQELLGWSKFNPEDIMTYPVRNNEGYLIGYKTKSKYSEAAGIRKALHRAFTKLVESVYEEN